LWQAWEACIEHAREAEGDFVDLCGTQTMALKECTDKHPEYYGSLTSSGDPDDEDDDS